MRYLIDTHVCLWAFAEKQKLSTRVKEILENFENEILYSQLSLLEIAIKFRVGKLPGFKLSLEQFNDFLQEKGFTHLPLEDKHLFAYFNCNFFSEEHRDPFDWCLVAIADTLQVALITNDEKFHLYKNSIDIIW
jgi:PIN domain nuclease of toxin-antitoxin system